MEPAKSAIYTSHRLTSIQGDFELFSRKHIEASNTETCISVTNGMVYQASNQAFRVTQKLGTRSTWDAAICTDSDYIHCHPQVSQKLMLCSHPGVVQLFNWIRLGAAENCNLRRFLIQRLFRQTSAGIRMKSDVYTRRESRNVVLVVVESS